MSTSHPDRSRATSLDPYDAAEVGDDILTRQAVHLEQVLPRIMFLLAVKYEPSAPDLPLAQLRVCAALMQGTWTVSELSREMGTTASAITQLADRLEAAGMVERVSDEHDRRSRSLRLTARGRSIMNSRRDQRKERARQALHELDAEARLTVLQSLDSLLEACSMAFSDPHHRQCEANSTRRKP